MSKGLVRARKRRSAALSDQERLDHASIKTTLDTYGHLFEGLDEAAADRLEATYVASDVHAMCTREEPEVIALSAE